MPLPYSYSSDIWLPLFTVFLLIALAAYSWRHRRVPGAFLFCIGSLLTTLWAIGSVMENAAVDPAVQIAWLKFQAIWQLPAYTVITCFVLEYTWPGRWLTRRNLVLLSLVPLLHVIAILTDDLHEFGWLGFGFNRSVVPLSGLGSWFFLAYFYGLGIINFIVFGWLFFHFPRQRWPAMIMLTGQIVAGLLFLLATINVIRAELSFDMIGLAFGFLMFGIVLFGFHILDPIPLARRMALEQMQAGMLVLDSQECVVSLNLTAERLLQIPAGYAVSRPVRELLTGYPDVPLDRDTVTELELSLGKDPDCPQYMLAISPLKDWRGLGVGYLLLLRDVTEQKRAQGQLIRQHQVLATLQERERLARDLHDSLGQVLGYASLQVEAAAKLARDGQAEIASAQLDRLGNVIREAHADVREHILNLRTTPSFERPFFTVVEQYLERFSNNYDIQTQLTIGPALDAKAFSPNAQLQVFRIVQEALSNARKHSNAHHVQVKFEADEERVYVTIQDDGSGFSPDDMAMAFGNHFGLQFMGERAGQLGASLQVQSTLGQGTRVVLEVPGREF